MAIDTSGMITVAEAAKRLHLSQEQVRRNLRDGKLRGQRIGNQWFVTALGTESRIRHTYLDPKLVERIQERKAVIEKRGPLPDVMDTLNEIRGEKEPSDFT